MLWVHEKFSRLKATVKAEKCDASKMLANVVHYARAKSCLVLQFLNFVLFQFLKHDTWTILSNGESVIFLGGLTDPCQNLQSSSKVG